MSDEAALLAAIRENEGEATPRLVYADWLDEHATTDAQRARAEFIRTSYQLLQLNGDFDAPEYSEQWWALANRQYELAQKYHPEWLSAFPLPNPLEPADFSVGFLAYLDLTGDQCLKLPRPPWEREPLLNVRLTGTTAEVCKVIGSDWLAGINSLHFLADSDIEADKVARAIAKAPCAANLRWLYFINQSLTDSGVRALAKSDRFQRLQMLHLGGDFGTKAWTAVVNSPIADRLTNLSFTYCAWDAEDEPWARGAAALAASPRLSKLTDLVITRTRLGYEGMRSILTAPHLQNLRLLIIAQEVFDEKTAKALETITLPKLEDLQITWSELSDAAVGFLARSGILPRLTYLDLSKNPLTAEGVRALTGSGPLSELKTLQLSETALGDSGAGVLARSHFPNLLYLNLSESKLGPKGASALIGASWADRLVRLDLNGNGIRKAGVSALTAPGRLSGLRRFDAERCVRARSLKNALTARFGEGLNL